MTNAAVQLIDQIGGPAAIARATGISDGAVRQWKFKGRIPRTAWPDLMRAFPDVATLETLGATEERIPI